MLVGGIPGVEDVLHGLDAVVAAGNGSQIDFDGRDGCIDIEPQRRIGDERRNV